MLYVFVRIFVKPFLWLKYRPQVVDRQYLNTDGGAIFVINHVSMGDPVMLALISLRYVHFMAKSELFQNPFLRVMFAALLAFPVNRNQADIKSLKHAMELLKQGKVFGIFAEGKRSVTGEVDDMEKGMSFLAMRSGAPIVPVYISPSTYRTGRLRARIGKPILASEVDESLPRNERMELLTNRVNNAIRALRTQQEKQEREAISCR